MEAFDKVASSGAPKVGNVRSWLLTKYWMAVYFVEPRCRGAPPLEFLEGGVEHK